MKILFNGIYCGEEITEKVMKGNNNIFPFAQQKLENLIIRGIEKNGKGSDLTVLSTLPVLRYPMYKKINIKQKEIYENEVRVKYLKFINLPILKQATIFISIICNILKWTSENKKEEKRVIIYGTNPVDIIPFLFLRKLKKYKVVAIVSEIDKLRLFKQDSLISRIKNFIFTNLSKIFQNSLDGYILICESMNNLINTQKKPYLIIEGMVQEEKVDTDITYKGKNNIIMYAGSLHKKYGINKLVEAFDNIQFPNYQLIIYGDGDYKEELIEKSKKNSNIIYGGITTNENILKLEKQAKVLVNPRPSNEKFTKYSFPSKTLEYFSSGTVALITRLEGIPKEYFEYCYTFEDEDIAGFQKALLDIIQKSDNELEKKAKNAKEFVLKNKNNNMQTKKILEFIYEL